MAARVGSPNVVLLQGPGVGPGAILARQAAFQQPILENYVDFLVAAGASATEITNAQLSVDANLCYTDYAVAQMDTIRSGALQPLLVSSPQVNSFPVPTPLAVSSTVDGWVGAAGG